MLSRIVRATALAVLIGLSGILAPQRAESEQRLTIFAAASLKNAADAVNAAFTAQTGIKTVASYAASSALIKQIEQGAPADVVISADREWMDYASQRKLVQDATRVDLLGNALVLIAPATAPIGPAPIASGIDLAGLAGDGRIAVGDVRAVPAGRYAKAALESLGVWPAVAPKLAMVENVRAALALVGRGEAALGIVYQTDANAEPAVKVIGRFPEGSHPPIVYPAAATAGGKPDAARYLTFLRSPEAKAVFERHGFTFLPPPGS
jgi:molybdate transport system substrate-binding protein